MSAPTKLCVIRGLLAKYRTRILAETPGFPGPQAAPSFLGPVYRLPRHGTPCLGQQQQAHSESPFPKAAPTVFTVNLASGAVNPKDAYSDDLRHCASVP